MEATLLIVLELVTVLVSSSQVAPTISTAELHLLTEKQVSEHYQEILALERYSTVSTHVY